MESVLRNQIFKLFIGGLTIETTETEILNHFSKFGFVFDILIIRNRESHISKGYGFISCNNINTYQRILSADHVIDGRVIDCHDSFKKTEEPQKFKENANKKIFVGGISLETTDQDLADYFGQFGPIRQAYVIKDPVTKRSKKFGFAIMKKQESVEKVLNCSTHILRGIVVSCKLFVRIDQQSTKQGCNQQTKIRRIEHSDYDGHQVKNSQKLDDRNENGEEIKGKFNSEGYDENQEHEYCSGFRTEPDEPDYDYYGVSAELESPQQGEFGHQESSRPNFSFRKQDCFRNRTDFRFDVFDHANDSTFSYPQTIFPPQVGFGLINDGYVVPMINHYEEIGTVKDQSPVPSSKQEVSTITKVESGTPNTINGLGNHRLSKLRDCLTYEPKDDHGADPSSALSHPGIGSSQINPNKKQISVDEVMQHQASVLDRLGGREEKNIEPGSAQKELGNEPPPFNRQMNRTSVREIATSHKQGQYHANQQNVISKGHPVMILDPDERPYNLRFNLCQCRNFYRRLRSRKPKAI